MELLPLHTSEIVPAVLFAFAWFYQLWFLLRRVRPLAFYQAPSPSAGEMPPVSVVICARDEAHNLSRFLPLVLNQDYPRFQVVVVNDNSEDESEEVLNELATKHDHLYTTTLKADKKFYRGKKVALSLGIKAARYPLLALTDADCKPSSDQWLSLMIQSLLQPGKKLVLGIGNYRKSKGLLNFWIRYDTFSIAIQYLGYALSGKPYMGVGRNMAYHKELFVNNGGFKNHMSVASGDDDLFVQEVANAENTAICIHPNAHTLSDAPPSFKEWRKQKQRHLTTSGKYRTHLKWELIMEPLTRILFWIGTLYYVIFHNFAAAGVLIWSLLMALKLLFWQRAARNTGLGKIYLGIFVFDFWQPITHFMMHAENRTGTKKRRWK